MTRIEPTSPGEKTNSPRFIKMNEVPQINDSNIRRVNALGLLIRLAIDVSERKIKRMVGFSKTRLLLKVYLL